MRVAAPFVVAGMIAAVAMSTGTTACFVAAGDRRPCNADAQCTLEERCVEGVCELRGADVAGDDAGAAREDAGTTRDDAGAAPVDAGFASVDGGDVSFDGGDVNDDDGGASVDDGGAPHDDGGASHDDSGVADDGGASVDDGGGPMIIVDAGVTGGPDAGPATCAALHDEQPGLRSGVHVLATRTTYCEMEHFGGGWERVVAFIGGDPCPGEWQAVDGPTEGCGRGQAVGGQRVVNFAIPYPYSAVMGRAHAWAFGAPDAFDDLQYFPMLDPDYTADGMDLHTTTPRTHLHTFAAAISDNVNWPEKQCPCAGGTPPPASIGNRWSCEGAAASYRPADPQPLTWDADDLLWDGAGAQEACPTGDDAEWFMRTLGDPTTSNIEARIIQTEGSGDEELAVILLELYIR